MQIENFILVKITDYFCRIASNYCRTICRNFNNAIGTNNRTGCYITSSQNHSAIAQPDPISDINIGLIPQGSISGIHNFILTEMRNAPMIVVAYKDLTPNQ